MHYTATLKEGGRTIDCSRSRGEPLTVRATPPQPTFSNLPPQVNIGVGEVIPAWDLAVPKMSVGEHAVITATGQYAYGEAGVPGSDDKSGEYFIPPNATLQFDVELIGTCEVGD